MQKEKTLNKSPNWQPWKPLPNIFHGKKSNVKFGWNPNDRTQSLRGMNKKEGLYTKHRYTLNLKTISSLKSNIKK